MTMSHEIEHINKEIKILLKMNGSFGVEKYNS